MEINTHQRGFSPRLILAAATLIAAFLLGGASRADVQSLIIFRPLSVLVFGVALWLFFSGRASSGSRFFLVALTAIFTLVAVHLVPLPPEVWTQLPGRAFIAELDQLTGVGPVWRPISLAPWATWNAFFSLFAPATMVLIALQLRGHELSRMRQLALALVGFSAALGLAQIMSSATSPLYIYDVTNIGSAVGLFANRNHSALALACMLPLLAAGVPQREEKSREGIMGRIGMGLAITIVVLALILAVGSRAGLLLALLAGALSLMLMLDSVRHFDRRRVLVFSAFGVAAIGLTLFLGYNASRALALGRVFEGLDDEVRLGYWKTSYDIAMLYFPVGSGMGSFEAVYRLHEPSAVLALPYVNHAHNDWIEIVLTGGLPAVALAIVLAVAWGRASFMVWSRSAPPIRELRNARAGSIILLLIGIGSVVDYPMRVPSIACLAALAAVWLHFGVRARQKQAVTKELDHQSVSS